MSADNTFSPGRLQSSVPGIVRWITVAGFLAGVLLYCYCSRHWQLGGDASVMHYVSLLMDHGWSPYRQTHDMNMPGAYMFESAALHIFGRSDFGWRLWDFTLAALLIGGMGAVASRYDWAAGVVAGCLFTLLHGADGAVMAGQRDQVMVVFLILGYAFCFTAVRRHVSGWMFVSCFFSCMAASIKPTLILIVPVLLALALVRLRKEKEPLAPYVLWALGGAVLPGVIVPGFLLWRGSMHDFLFDFTVILPHYTTLSPPSWAVMFQNALPLYMYLFIVLAVVAFALEPGWRNWEALSLVCGIVFGLVHYFGQRKGFPQHRYPLLAFLLLTGCIQIFLVLRSANRAKQWAAAFMLLLLLFSANAGALRAIRHSSDSYRETVMMQQDLEKIGAARLQNSVQCMEINEGCMTSLFHMDVVQSTGATGDLLLFLPRDSEPVRWARATFWKEFIARPPDTIVLTNAIFRPYVSSERTQDFDKVQTWPMFAGYLADQYQLVMQREFPSQGPPTSTPGTNPNYPAYRIYVRKGSAVANTSLRP